MTYHQWGPVTTTWRKFHKGYISHQLLKLACKTTHLKFQPNLPVANGLMTTPGKWHNPIAWCPWASNIVNWGSGFCQSSPMHCVSKAQCKTGNSSYCSLTKPLNIISLEKKNAKFSKLSKKTFFDQRSPETHLKSTCEYFQAAKWLLMSWTLLGAWFHIKIKSVQGA